MASAQISNFVLRASEYNPENERKAYRDPIFLMIPAVGGDANFKLVWRPELYRWILDNQENGLDEVINAVLDTYEPISKNSPLHLDISKEQKVRRLKILCRQIGWKTKTVAPAEVASIFEKIKEFYQRYGRQEIGDAILQNYQQYVSVLTNNTEAPMTPVKGAAARVGDEGGTARAPNNPF